MDQYLLPATRYEAPVRQVRRTVLNTIIEDEHSEDERPYGRSRKPKDGWRGRSRHLFALRSSASTSPVPSLTSSRSSTYRSKTRSQDFDELYDVTDDESVSSQGEDLAVYSQNGSSRSVSPNGFVYTKGDGKRCPSLIIPSPNYWPTVQKLQQSSPTPPPKIPISPAALSLLPYDQSTLSHPPSLDGSLVSDPLARSTAPSTPDTKTPPTCIRINGGAEKAGDYFGLRIQTNDPEDFYVGDSSHFEKLSMSELQPDAGLPTADSPVLGSEVDESEAGVQLPQGAFATLQNLTLEIPQTPKLPQHEPEHAEMEEVATRLSRHNSMDFTPMSYDSEYSLSQLSIPSPGGFFSSLDGNAQDTWRLPPSNTGPSSAAAEHFYKRPWDAEIVEQIVEVEDEGTEGPLTARQPVTAIRIEDLQPEVAEIAEAAPSISSSNDFDEEYEKTIQESADNSLDRTSLWLADQTSYMAALRETNPVNDVSLTSETSTMGGPQHSRESSMSSPMKKVVRFLENEARDEPEPIADESNPIFYHAFQHVANNTRKGDAFLYRQARADAIQAERIGMPKYHIERLKGSFEVASKSRVAPLRPISMFPGKADQTEPTEEQKLFAAVEHERQALNQMNCSIWAIESSKQLNGGKLFVSPAANLLLGLPADPASGQQRVLDLGGDVNCDWAWHVARAYPTTKVYTVSTAAPDSEKLRGPRNYARKVIPSLSSLPYPDSYFTAISARNLFSHLKTVPNPGSNSSLCEYDLCLAECNRVLRPGGYLEFSLLDSEILHAGPRATALSVEFGFNLKTRGYDPNPTKNFLPRVHKAGFSHVKRAWIFTPMGAPSSAKTPTGAELPETPPPDVSTLEADLVHFEAIHGEAGSTADVAPMTAMVGAWEWEKWLLKLHNEMGREGEDLLANVAVMMEEGKRGGAGWRCLKGWARK